MSNSTPRHVAVIMDRNGEWAKKRTLSRVMGHKEGVKSVKRVIKAAVDNGVDYLSLFAFSTENWRRPKDEVNFLMKLLEEFIKKEGREFTESGIKLVVSGGRDKIPETGLAAVDEVVEMSAANSRLTVNIALDYGGRDEIIRACKKAIQSGADMDKLNEETFRSYMYHPTMPDIDLLIRTGGEKRISNFMLWHLAYSELYFTDTLWPDFTEDDFKEALNYFKSRVRRFGQTQEQLERK